MTEATQDTPVEQPTGLVIVTAPPSGAIEANFDAMRAKIEGLVSDYRGMEVTQDNLKQAKRDRAYLNNLSKSLNQQRRDVKEDYLRPVTAFEAEIKSLDAPILEASSAIDIQVKKFEEAAKVAEAKELREHYEALAGALVEVVPYDRVADPKWLNVSVSMKKAKDSIEEIVDKLVRDEATLTELCLDHPNAAKAAYFATFDIGKAVARSKEITERERKAAELEATKQQIAADRKADAEAERAETQASAEVGEEKVPDAPSSAVVIPPEKPEQEADWTITVRCLRSDLAEIGEALNALGYSGTFSKA